MKPSKLFVVFVVTAVAVAASRVTAALPLVWEAGNGRWVTQKFCVNTLNAMPENGLCRFVTVIR